MKRKTFELEDSLVAAFEAFCSDRRLVEKQVVESLIAHFMKKDAETREEMLMTRYESDGQIPPLRVAAKPSSGAKAHPMRGPKT